MSARGYRDYLQDISDELDNVAAFTKGLDRAGFRGSLKSIYSCAKALENIGEAVKHIPPSVRDKYPEVPWKKMAGVRDVIAHEYFGMDTAMLWRTIEESLPELRRLVARVMKDLG